MRPRAIALKRSRGVKMSPQIASGAQMSLLQSPPHLGLPQALLLFTLFLICMFFFSFLCTSFHPLSFLSSLSLFPVTGQRHFSLTGKAEVPPSKKQARLDVKWKADLTDWPELTSRGREREGFVFADDHCTAVSTSLGAHPSSELWKGCGHVDIFSPLPLHRCHQWASFIFQPTSVCAGTCMSALFQPVTVGSALRASQSFKLTDESLMDMMGARWLNSFRYQ